MLDSIGACKRSLLQMIVVCCADDSDMKTMLDDLGSLSSLPPMTVAVQQSSQDKRFKWLNPWRWISGLGWRQSKKRGAIELTVQVRGKGLENCTKIQVTDFLRRNSCIKDVLHIC